METSDPDDFLTLLLLLGHPRVNLRAVTVTPGTQAQVGLIRKALSWFGREDIPVGAFDLRYPKDCVSAWHDRAFGKAEPSTDAEPGPELLRRICDEHTTLVTGAPLKNLGGAVHMDGFSLGRWVAQGGFAGEGVVPPDQQLPQFRGRATCPSFNLDGARQAAFDALAAPGIGRRYFVSKNVCHGVVYDHALHEAVGAVQRHSLSLRLIHRAMDMYLRKNPGGKKLHDPLAACCAIDPSIGIWREVEPFRSPDGWGARLAPGSGTFIIVGYDPARFATVFTAHHMPGVEASPWRAGNI